MAWKRWPLDRTEMGPLCQKNTMPVVLCERVDLSCTCQEESTDANISSELTLSSSSLSSSHRDQAMP